jgi:hypothetical protein
MPYVQIEMNDEDYEKLKQIAAADGRSVRKTVARLIAAELEKNKK